MPISTTSHSSNISLLKLAGEEASRVPPEVSRQDVLREDVNEERDDGEGENHLVDEVEGDELRHGGLDWDLHNVFVLVAFGPAALMLHLDRQRR